MSYAGVEREYRPRCAPRSHDWAFNRTCRLCGVSKDYLEREAREILGIPEDGTPEPTQ